MIVVLTGLYYDRCYAQVNNLNEPGSILVYPLIDNINYKTIIKISNTGISNIVLECSMVTKGAGEVIDRKDGFIIKMTPKEEFWWKTDKYYYYTNVNGDTVGIQGFDARQGYMFCFAVNDEFARIEKEFNYLKGGAIVYSGRTAFSYSAIPSQGLAVVGDRVLNKDGVEYTMSTSRIMFEGFTSGTFGVSGTLAVANIGVDYIQSIQPEFDINFNCYNENEIWGSRHTHYKDFEQYNLSDSDGLYLISTMGKAIQCTADSTNALEAVFSQTTGGFGGLAFGGNVWQNPDYGVPTTTILPPVAN